MPATAAATTKKEATDSQWVLVVTRKRLLADAVAGLLGPRGFVTHHADPHRRPVADAEPGAVLLECGNSGHDDSAELAVKLRELWPAARLLVLGDPRSASGRRLAQAAGDAEWVPRNAGGPELLAALAGTPLRPGLRVRPGGAPPGPGGRAPGPGGAVVDASAGSGGTVAADGAGSPGGTAGPGETGAVDGLAGTAGPGTAEPTTISGDPPLTLGSDSRLPSRSAPRPLRRRTLTEREVQVVRLVAAGRRAEEISRTLSISEHTVRKHIQNAMLKLGAHSRLAAVARARRLGLLA